MSRLVRLLFPFHRLWMWFGLVLLVVVGAAFAVVGLTVVPSLRQSLERDRVSHLRTVALSTRLDVACSLATYASPRCSEDPPSTEQVVNAIQVVNGARVAVLTDTFFSVIAGDPGQSNETSVVRAAARNGSASGIVDAEKNLEAQYAYRLVVPGGSTYIVLFRDPLQDVGSSVALVRQRLLGAGLVALAIAAVLGALAATVLAARIRRLERAARRIADGHLDEPVSDPGRDEVARLAATFDDMRARLERTETARRDFISNASHELRTPLFALGGYLEMLELEEDLDDAERAEFLLQMRGAVERMTRLSTELLDLSRLDSGTASFRSHPFDLEEVVHDVASEFAVVAERAGSTVRIAEPFPEIEVVGDDLRAAQIIRILIDNALKHNPPGVHVLIDPEVRDGRVRLAVADDGPPIPEENEERLFDRFARGRTTAEGSGLGLAIARELALRMHGRLALDQRERSKAFVLDLPGGLRSPS